MVKKTLRNLVIGTSVILGGVCNNFHNYLNSEQIKDRNGRVIGVVDSIDMEKEGVDPRYRPENMRYFEGYIYESWQDGDNDKWPDCPTELLGSNRNCFNIDKDIEFGAYLKNLQGYRLSFRLFSSDEKEIKRFFDVDVKDSEIFYRTFEKDGENVAEFAKNFGSGVFYIGFFLDDKCVQVKKFNVLLNHSETKYRPITPGEITRTPGKRL